MVSVIESIAGGVSSSIEGSGRRVLPHVAFEVTDLCSELPGREILIPSNSPCDGVRVAFIVENGVPSEPLEFTAPEYPARLSNKRTSNGQTGS